MSDAHPHLSEFDVDHVWVRYHTSSGGGKTIVHTQGDCITVKKMDKAQKKEASMYPGNQSVCKWCAGIVDTSREDSRRSLRDKLSN